MTRYDLFRRRFAPIAFGLAIAFMAYQTCEKQERTSATIVLDCGAADQQVAAIEAEIWMNGEQVGQFRRSPAAGGTICPTQFKASLPDTDGELRMDIELKNGEHRAVTRAIHVSEASTVTIQLERDLR